MSRSRFDRFADDHAGRLDDLFTTAELERSEAGSLAAAWAIKESTLKAIGALTGWEMDWREIEAVRIGRDAQVELTGKAADVAAQRGIAAFHVSLTETDSYCLATTVALGV